MYVVAITCNSGEILVGPKVCITYVPMYSNSVLLVWYWQGASQDFFKLYFIKWQVFMALVASKCCLLLFVLFVLFVSLVCVCSLVWC